MEQGKTVFAQLMDFLPSDEFRKCVERYDGHFKVKSFSCWDQFLAMAFAQLTFRESLRDIQACLVAARPKLYHMGFRSPVHRNTLANANQARSWRIYADFAQVLIGIARPLYAGEDFGVDLSNTVYALEGSGSTVYAGGDYTTIGGATRNRIAALDASTGKLAVMADDIPGPNGLAFSPDEKKLYVVASRAEPHRAILSYDVTADGTRFLVREPLAERDASPITLLTDRTALAGTR